MTSDKSKAATIDLPALRHNLAEDRRRIREQFFAGGDPMESLAALTRSVDQVLAVLFSRRLPQRGFCVVAIGGYGRRQIFPASDVDLLFLYDGDDTKALEEATTACLRDLWDVGLRIGQQVWSWRQLRELTNFEFEFATALLDSRHLWGDEELSERLLHDFVPSFLSERHTELCGLLLQATRRRHLEYRDTIYQLEPDLKLSPGGLRDYHVGRWLARVEDAAVFVPFGRAELEAAHAFVARLRIFLHFFNGRDRNVLSHALQERLAGHVGYSQSSTRSAVESLMKEYFLRARTIDSFCRRTIRTVSAAGGDEIGLAEMGRLDSMGDAIDLFIRVSNSGRELAEAAENAVVEALPRLSASLSYPLLGDKLLKLFGSVRGLYPALGEMYQLGVLEQLIPEFGSIKARVIRDFYHKYTVDEHSLQAIKAVADLARLENDTDPRFRGLLEEEPHPEALNLTLLLHDIGKSRGGKHVDTGARMAAKALRRFRLEKSTVDTIIFLIRNHLAMSAVAFRRNLEDGHEIRRFADLVQNTENLRLLCLLTYADMTAVGPNTLNDWRRDRLWQLYVATYNELTLRFGDERIDEEDIGDRLLTGLPADLDPEGFEGFLEGFPRRYLTGTPAEEIYQHYRLGKRVTVSEPVQTRLTDRKTHFELCVVTADRYYLFSKIAGLLTYFEMNIHRGYGFSNRHNTVLDFFQFTDTSRVFAINPEEKERFQALLHQVIEGRVSVESLLARKESSPIFKSAAPRFDPVVYFADSLEDRPYSIVEIVAPDSIGLLYRISREIARLRCNIELVLISTEGGKAVDVFYLTHDGGKLDRALRTRLVENVSESIRSQS